MSEVKACGSDRNDSAQVIGFDGYNLVTTGEISRTLTLARVDVPNIPVVFIRRNVDEK
jgi:hypothetical protein